MKSELDCLLEAVQLLRAQESVLCTAPMPVFRYVFHARQHVEAQADALVQPLFQE